MTHDDQALLEKYGITTELKTVYLYRGYRYDHLKDAINYARIDADKEKASAKR